MQPSRADIRCSYLGLFVLVVLLVCTTTGVQLWRSTADRPTQPQRIAAILVSWGLSAEGFSIPVDQEEIKRHIAMLRSPYSEERVLAARWLASHGVRDAGAAIADAMNDSGTRRPCQLAHALGQLGDDQWVDELVRATTQPWNQDLQLCATIGLEELASARAVEALIELMNSGAARTTAVRALGVIGDPAAIPPLQTIAKTTHERIVREFCEQAISRIKIVTLGDPTPALVHQMQSALRSGHADEWALRWIATIGDERAVGVLAAALTERGLSMRDHERIAATLLALDEEGISALEHIASSESASRRVAQSALSISTHRDVERLARSR